MSLADVDELYGEQQRIAAEMQELLKISRQRVLTQFDQAKLDLLTAQLLAIPKKIVALLEPSLPPPSEERSVASLAPWDAIHD